MNEFERTFDLSAEDYDRSRPVYIKELYDDIFRYQSVGPGSNVLEIGMGTGKATLPILETGCRLTGLEPGQQLAALAKEKFQGYKNIFICQQTLQEYTGTDGTFDVVYAATAFHWLPESYGYRRVYNLLKNGGAFARFAYHAGTDRKRTTLAEEIQELYKACLPQTGGFREYCEADAEQLAGLAANYGFTDTKYHLYSMTKDFTADEYMILLRTYPDHMRMEPESRKKLFDGIHSAILKHGGTITVYYTFDLELARKP